MTIVADAVARASAGRWATLGGSGTGIVATAAARKRLAIIAKVKTLFTFAHKVNSKLTVQRTPKLIVNGGGSGIAGTDMLC